MTRTNFFSEFLLKEQPAPSRGEPVTYNRNAKIAFIGVTVVSAALAKIYLGKLDTSSISSDAKAVDAALIPSSLLLISGPAIQLSLSRDIPYLTLASTVAGAGYLLYKTGSGVTKVGKLAISK